MRTTLTARAAAAAAVLALALTACNGEDPQDPATAPSADASASNDAQDDSAAAGPEETPEAAGFDNALGAKESATATHKDDDGDTELEIRPDKVVKGSWADFKGFDLEGLETKGQVPYYVTMAYTSKGGAEPWIPGWDGELDGMLAPERPAQGVNMLDDFAKCPGVDKSVPSGKFKVGTTDRPCNIFVVPEGESLYMQWGADVEGQKPLVWKVAG